MILLLLSPQLVKPENIVVDDFSQFWAAGKLNITGGNPYNPEEISQTIRDIGGEVSNSDVVSIMLNPPWTLSLIMPFSLISYPISRLIWLLVNTAIVLLSVKLLWGIYDGKENDSKKAMLMVFLFSPVLAALQKGQFTPFILLGIVLAIFEIKKHNNYRIAGIFFAWVAFKPQLIYLLWIVLILLLLIKKKWQLPVTIFITIFFLTMIPLLVNPDVIEQYLQSMREYPFSAWATPTIGSTLRVIFGIEKFWLQFLPTVIGIAIYSLFWFKHKETWDWIAGTPMIVAASMLSTAYAWTYDAILFVIPIVHASIYAVNYHSKKMNLILFFSILIISLLNLLLHTRLNDFWFMWLFPILFIWYIITKMTLPGYKKSSYG